MLHTWTVVISFKKHAAESVFMSPILHCGGLFSQVLTVPLGALYVMTLCVVNLWNFLFSLVWGESSRNIDWMTFTEGAELERNMDRAQAWKLALAWFSALHYSQIIAFRVWFFNRSDLEDGLKGKNKQTITRAIKSWSGIISLFNLKRKSICLLKRTLSNLGDLGSVVL